MIKKIIFGGIITIACIVGAHEFIAPAKKKTPSSKLKEELAQQLSTLLKQTTESIQQSARLQAEAITKMEDLAYQRSGSFFDTANRDQLELFLIQVQSMNTDVAAQRKILERIHRGLVDCDKKTKG